MAKLLIFGLGYTASRLAGALEGQGWEIAATRREADARVMALEDTGAVLRAIQSATHILSSVPPGSDGDPVLDLYGQAIAAAPARWTGYLSSTGIYGDTGGAWADESAPAIGRRRERIDADARWLALPNARVFRLPGIYGPGRSALDRVREGKAHRIDLPGQIFSRVHADDIIAGVIASFTHGGPGAYNLADDEPASQNAVIERACRLLGIEPPPLIALDDPALTPAARAFYAENRRVANGKAKRELGWMPRYPSYREGLAKLAA